MERKRRIMLDVEAIENLHESNSSIHECVTRKHSEDDNVLKRKIVSNNRLCNHNTEEE